MSERCVETQHNVEATFIDVQSTSDGSSKCCSNRCVDRLNVNTKSCTCLSVDRDSDLWQT
jgi:hypothetical protein